MGQDSGPGHVNQYSGYQVVINKNGQPKRTLRNVLSVMEVSNEEAGCIAGMSFHHQGHWVDIRNEEFDRITIEKERPSDEPND